MIHFSKIWIVIILLCPLKNLFAQSKIQIKSVSASSSDQVGKIVFHPENSIDRSRYSYWVAKSEENPWIKYTFDSNTKLDFLILYNEAFGKLRDMKTRHMCELAEFDIEFSNGEKKTHKLRSGHKTHLIKLNIKDIEWLKIYPKKLHWSRGVENDHAPIREIEFFGETPNSEIQEEFDTPFSNIRPFLSMNDSFPAHFEGKRKKDLIRKMRLSQYTEEIDPGYGEVRKKHYLICELEITPEEDFQKWNDIIYVGGILNPESPNKIIIDNLVKSYRLNSDDYIQFGKTTGFDHISPHSKRFGNKATLTFDPDKQELVFSSFQFNQTFNTAPESLDLNALTNYENNERIIKIENWLKKNSTKTRDGIYYTELSYKAEQKYSVRLEAKHLGIESLISSEEIDIIAKVTHDVDYSQIMNETLLFPSSAAIIKDNVMVKKPLNDLELFNALPKLKRINLYISTFPDQPVFDVNIVRDSNEEIFIVVNETNFTTSITEAEKTDNLFNQISYPEKIWRLKEAVQSSKEKEQFINFNKILFNETLKEKLTYVYYDLEEYSSTSIDKHWFFANLYLAINERYSDSFLSEAGLELRTFDFGDSKRSLFIQSEDFKALQNAINSQTINVDNVISGLFYLYKQSINIDNNEDFKRLADAFQPGSQKYILLLDRFRFYLAND
jgi:hypothetical protein